LKKDGEIKEVEKNIMLLKVSKQQLEEKHTYFLRSLNYGD